MKYKSYCYAILYALFFLFFLFVLNPKYDNVESRVETDSLKTESYYICVQSGLDKVQGMVFKNKSTYIIVLILFIIFWGFSLWDLINNIEEFDNDRFPKHRKQNARSGIDNRTNVRYNGSIATGTVAY